MNTRMQIPAKAATVSRLGPSPTLQRKCACGGSGSSGECTECREKTLQPRAAGDGPAVAPPIVHDVLRSPGQPLDAETRAYFEPRFGHDFSKVRVHDDAEARESAEAVRAQAYTVAQEIVFAKRPALGTAAARALLAHELTHVVQQSSAVQNSPFLRVGAADSPHEKEAERAAQATALNKDIQQPQASGPALQRQPNQMQEAGSNTCDKEHVDAIHAAQDTAADWVSKSIKWIENHRDHIKKRAHMGSTGYNTVGTEIFNELQLLDKHFRISQIISGEMHTLFPSSPDATASFEAFNNWGRADYDMLSKLTRVRIRDLTFDCQPTCPKGEQGTERLGQAPAGSGAFTICTGAFDRQLPKTKAGAVLHEAFHATFSEFNHDTYSFESAYPGQAPRTNAESFATFAAVAATGSDFRIIAVPEITIKGAPNP